MNSPDLRRPGAILAWNYEDYVLTLQNQGPSSAGYCEESDEGTYLVKRTDDGGIQFKLLSDSCAFRTYSMHRFGSNWDPYEP